ncbi:hypothetical protein BZJ19_05585 [Salinivibrio proteolyticus]|nr:hypothetical protein BZJ19_05585 [Salinivibrio proteolyticus]
MIVILICCLGDEKNSKMPLEFKFTRISSLADRHGEDNENMIIASDSLFSSRHNGNVFHLLISSLAL